MSKDRKFQFYKMNKPEGLQYSTEPRVYLHTTPPANNNNEVGGDIWRLRISLKHTVVMVSHILISKLIKLYTFNMYNFLHINHTSIKWFQKTDNFHLQSAS